MKTECEPPDLAQAITAFRSFCLEKDGLSSPIFPEILKAREKIFKGLPHRQNPQHMTKADLLWQSSPKQARCGTISQETLLGEFAEYLERIQKYKSVYEVATHMLDETLPEFEDFSPEKLSFSQKEILRKKTGYWHEAAPDKQCSCGLYGAFALDYHQVSGKTSGDVTAVCHFWGKAEVHKDGLRSQFCSIKAVAVKSPLFFLLKMELEALFLLIAWGLAWMFLSFSFFLFLCGLGALCGLLLLLVFGRYWQQKYRLKKLARKMGWHFCKTKELPNHMSSPLPERLKQSSQERK